MKTFISKLKAHRDFTFISTSKTQEKNSVYEESVSFKYKNSFENYTLTLKTNYRTMDKTYKLSIKDISKTISFYIATPSLADVAYDIDAMYYNHNS